MSGAIRLSKKNVYTPM